jgi:tetratricopeptide (TPR) repeat protein
MYLPLAALVVLAVVGGTRVWGLLAPRLSASARDPQLAATAAVFVLAASTAALGAETVRRNREYESELLLAQLTVDRYPTPVGHHVLGEALLAAGRRDAGIAHLRQALPGAPRAHLPLGVELFKEGKLEEAIAELQAFIKEQPNLLHVIRAHEYLGRTFARQERWPEAIAQFEQILRLSPGNPAAELLLGEVSFSQQTTWTRSTSSASRSDRWAISTTR